MRRVYALYMLNFFTHPAFSHGILMSVLVGVFTRFVSLGHVFENLLMVPVGEVFAYFYDALLTTESWTFITLGLMLFVLNALRKRMQFGIEMQTA